MTDRNDRKSFYRLPRWRALRKRILNRDNWQCQRCGADLRGHSRAAVDHIKPRLTHPELVWEESNLQSLCPACHGAKRPEERPKLFGLDGWPA